MTPEQALKDAETSSLRPVYLVHGSERFLHDEVLSALRRATLAQGIPGLNDDQLVAGETSVDAALNIARTVPMMASRRLVLVRHIDRWESKGGKGQADLERLVEYANNPADTCVLVLSSATLDKRRKLFTAAKKQGWLVECNAPNTRELPGWVAQAIKKRGCKASHHVAELIAQIGGTELAQLDDAVERVCLYVGRGNEITEAVVGECIVRLTTTSAFELVDAITKRDLAMSLKTLAEVYDHNDRGLRLVGLLAWSTRQLIGFVAARRSGMSPPDAAKAAGAPPFKANDLEQQTKKISIKDLEVWLCTLNRVDIDLKGGSARHPQAVLEEAIIGLCSAPRPKAAPLR